MISDEVEEDPLPKGEFVKGLEQSSNRSIGRQIQILMRKQIQMKLKAMKWTLLEIFFPLYPCMFLFLIFEFGEDFLPFSNCGDPSEKCYRAADPTPVAQVAPRGTGFCSTKHQRFPPSR